MEVSTAMQQPDETCFCGNNYTHNNQSKAGSLGLLPCMTPRIMRQKKYGHESHATWNQEQMCWQGQQQFT
jgi:hypothetical protein